MKIQGLIELAQQGKLTLHKYGNNFVRNKYIYSDEPDILDEKIIRLDKVPYRRYYYFAHASYQPENENYKITKKDWDLLIKEGAKESA